MEGHFILNRHFNVSNEIQFYVKYLFIFPSDGIEILQVKLLTGICLQSVCLLGLSGTSAKLFY